MAWTGRNGKKHKSKTENATFILTKCIICDTIYVEYERRAKVHDEP